MRDFVALPFSLNLTCQYSMNNGRQYLIVSVIVFSVLLVFTAGCTGTVPVVPGPGSTGTTPGVLSASPPDHAIFVEPNEGRAEVLKTIAGARKNITLTIFQLDDPAIVAALAAAQERGVLIRVLYNNASFAAANQTNPNFYAVANLTPLGVSMKPAPPYFTITHQKTLTADRSRAIIMTFNLDPAFFSTTRDFGIVTTKESEIREIAEVFEADWNYRNVSPSQPSLIWGPVNSRAKILGLINNATRTLEVYNDEITDPQCIDALGAAAKRGVVVRVLAANMQGTNGTNVNAPALATLNANGAQAKTITSLYIHAKVAVADYGTPKQVAYVGSEYLAPVSLDHSRELAILVSEQPILDRIESVFSQDWLVPAMPEPSVAPTGKTGSAS
jgi:phosphatidylserine/phosphatidylglycerophosphate/cardiolipin synthase-like enzyme